MIYLEVKPLSANRAYSFNKRSGRRYKTELYQKYEAMLLSLLPDHIDIYDKMCFNVAFGVSNSRFDTDNGIKPLLDVLQKKYWFNDNSVYKIIAEKFIEEKGNEYIVFSFNEYEEDTLSRIKLHF